MRWPEGQEQGDDLHVEVSNLHDSEGAPDAGQTHSPFTPRRSPRARAVGLLATALLAALVLASIPGLRQAALGVIGWPTGSHAPTATRVPAGSLFYLLPNPPGVDVSLDGKRLASLPLPGSGYPLHLTPGTHTLRWTSQHFPLLPLMCRISVPQTATDTCPIVDGKFIPNTLAGEPGAIIGMHASIGALATADQQALNLAIQAALAAQRSTTTVGKGERYALYDTESPTAHVVTTDQPVQATLTFDYFSDAGYLEPCILGQPAIPCRFPGQDCTQICTVTQPPPALAGASSDQTWIGAVVIHASWDYSLPHGPSIARQVGEALGLQLAALRIAYAGGQWQVSAIIGNIPGFDLASDPVCDPARYLLSQNNVWAFAVYNPPPGARMAFVPAPNPADGCAAVFLGHNAPSEEPAMFFQRFGVLRAVNGAAANPVANLPMADAYEQSLARQLLAPLRG